jgi:hypothetical protein
VSVLLNLLCDLRLVKFDCLDGEEESGPLLRPFSLNNNSGACGSNVETSPGASCEPFSTNGGCVARQRISTPCVTIWGDARKDGSEGIIISPSTSSDSDGVEKDEARINGRDNVVGGKESNFSHSQAS